MSTAPGWEKWADWHEQQQAVLTEWLCREAAVDGARVLDLATGVGQPGLHAARRAKHLIASDVAADMLAAFDRRARAAGLTNVELRELDMHELRGIADDSIDAVTLGFALMFSREPVRVMREIRRVLRPGGRFALCVWDEPSKNPFFTAMFGALGRIVPMEPPAPGAPGPFGLAAPGALERAIRDAGFETVTVESVPFTYEFDTLESVFEINRTLAAPLKRAADTLPPADVARLRDAFADAYRPYLVGERVRVTATSLCASGRK